MTMHKSLAFLELTCSGSKLYINAGAVVSVSAEMGTSGYQGYPTIYTRISVGDGEDFLVDESVEDILEMLRECSFSVVRQPSDKK